MYNMHTYKYTCVHNMCLCVSISTQYMCTPKHICVCTHVHNTCTHTHTHTHTHIQAAARRVPEPDPGAATSIAPQGPPARLPGTRPRPPATLVSTHAL